MFLFIAAHAVVRKWVLLTDPDDKMAGVKVRNLAFTGRDKPDCFESLSTSTGEGEVGRAVSCGVIWLLTNKCCTLSLITDLPTSKTCKSGDLAKKPSKTWRLEPQTWRFPNYV